MYVKVKPVVVLTRCRYFSVFGRTAMHASMTSVTARNYSDGQSNDGHFQKLQLLWLPVEERSQQCSRKGGMATLSSSVDIELTSSFSGSLFPKHRGKGEALRDNVEGVFGSHGVLIHLPLRQISALVPLIVRLYDWAGCCLLHLFLACGATPCFLLVDYPCNHVILAALGPIFTSQIAAHVYIAPPPHGRS